MGMWVGLRDSYEGKLSSLNMEFIELYEFGLGSLSDWFRDFST